MTVFEKFDASNINYKACLSYGTVFLDGFRNDYFFTKFHPEYFGPNATASKSERNEFFARSARYQARNIKHKVMSGAATLVVASEKDDPEAVAVCLVDLPEAQRISLSFWQWIKYKVYGFYIPIAEFLEGKHAKEFEDAQVSQLFSEVYEVAGGIEGPEYYAKLADMSRDELAKVKYPVKETLYINVLSVREDCHGKGYGPQILNWVIDHYQYLKGPVFTSGTKQSPEAPPKTSLFPSKGKEPFYNKYGFYTMSTGEVDIVDDKFEHKFMQRLLHNES